MVENLGRLLLHESLNVIAVNRLGQWTEAKPQSLLEARDVLLIAGRSDQVERLASLWDPRND